MQKDIHPQYHPKAKVHCACGNTFTVGSTKPELEVDICFQCHPFYTGEQKLIDTAGRVEKFRSRTGKAQPVKDKKTRVKKQLSRNLSPIVKTSAVRKTAAVKPKAAAKKEKK